MKKIWLFILGGILIIVLGGFWIYSFLYGSTSNSSAVFTDFNLFGGNDTPIVTEPLPPPVTETPTVDVASAPLRQLTTRPVIGMRAITVGTTTVMRYVEAGTGHVFAIDLTTGAETRISQISVPVASEAVFSPSGQYVAIRSGYDTTNEVSVINLDAMTPTSTVLPYQIEDVTFGYNNQLWFTEFVSGKTVGKQYDPTTRLTTNLFTIPFTAVTIEWSTSSSTPHYAYTKPAPDFIGYGYEIKNGGIVRLPYSGYNVRLYSVNAGLVITKSEGVNGQIASYFYHGDDNGSRSVYPILGHEKCVSLTRTGVFCATNDNTYQNSTQLTRWSMGVLSSSDTLYQIGFSGSAQRILELKTETGRDIDVMNMDKTIDGKMVYFTNANDKTLWVYDIDN